MVLLATESPRVASVVFRVWAAELTSTVTALDWMESVKLTVAG